MCLLALFFRAVADAPVVLGANREEAYARGGTPPQLLGEPPALAGLDPQAGGTWLGINPQGVIVALTNRPRSEVPARPRSRGLLAREILSCPSARVAAEQAAKALDRGPYAGCNFLCVDRESALVVQAGDWLRVRPLPPGLHVLTARDVNDPSDPRLSFASWWLQERSCSQAADCVAALTELCARPGDAAAGEPAICLHGALGGTVSSTIIALRDRPATSLYLHAQGPPDRAAYQDYSSLLTQLMPQRPAGA